MTAIPSTLQVLLASVLVVISMCGNHFTLFVSHRTTLRCPHIKVLAALDLTVTLLGPGLIVAAGVVDSTWFEHNNLFCQSLSFLSSSLSITCFLVLLVLALFCQKFRHHVYPQERRRARRKQFVFLAVCCLSGLVLGVPPLLGWSSYNGLPFLHSCSVVNHVQTLSRYSAIYFGISFTALCITIFLAIRAVKWRHSYPMQLFWERHVLETKINDPEKTTAGSSLYSSGQFSRASSISAKRSGYTSACNSPATVRKYSRKSAASMEGTFNVLLEKIRRQNEITHARQTGNSRHREEPAAQPSVTSGIPWQCTVGKAFVISSGIPYTFKTKNIFKSGRCLPRLYFPQQQRSLSRLLSLRCCVTLLCWLPLYTAVMLRQTSDYYPQDLHTFIRWLIFMHPSICALVTLCDASYRQVLHRASHSCFKAYARKGETNADMSKLRDVEGNQQVLLKEVNHFDASKL